MLAWLGAGKKGASHLRERAAAGRTFESIGDEWIADVPSGKSAAAGLDNLRVLYPEHHKQADQLRQRADHGYTAP